MTEKPAKPAKPGTWTWQEDAEPGYRAASRESAKEPGVVEQSAEAKREMRFRISDWRRIRRDFRRLKPSWSSAWFAGASLSFGIAAAAGLSLISVYNVDSGTESQAEVAPPLWIVVVHAAVAAAFGLASLICLIGGVMASMSYRRRRSDLDQELDFFEKGFEWKEKEATEVGAATDEQAPDTTEAEPQQVA